MGATPLHPLRQAVILAGGRGTRLLPLTLTRPKPMVEVHGRPFLAYLLEQLRDQGIERVVLLLGYLPQVIQDYIGDGRAFGLKVDYVVTAVEDETGPRLRAARALLDDRFFLLYCDNYWPFDLNRMWAQYEKIGAAAQISVYRNRDGHTKHNLRVDTNGRVALYDKSRTAPGLSGVDIGFAIMPRSVIDTLPVGNESFEKRAYTALVARGELGAFETDHRYYGPGTLQRLPELQRFLARTPTVILDRDGTLNRQMGRAEYVTTTDQFVWLPGAREAVARLSQAGYRVLIATNQPGIARGALTEAQLTAIHDRMTTDVRALGGDIAAIYHCPHNWDEGCECRKPAPGLLFQAQRDFALDLSRTPFFGDDPRDGAAAEAAGCPFTHISAEYPLAAAVNTLLARQKAA